MIDANAQIIYGNLAHTKGDSNIDISHSFKVEI